MSKIMQTIYQAILEGDQPTVEEAVKSALQANASPAQLLDGAMLPAMNEVGRLFEAGEYFVPEMLIAARAMQGGLAILKPLLVSDGVEPAGRVVIGTVKGDMHDVGKNLVTIMLEGAGFEIHDLGVDVPLTDAFAHQIGADGFAPDASRAVTLVKKLVGIKEAA